MATTPTAFMRDCTQKHIFVSRLKCTQYGSTRALCNKKKEWNNENWKSRAKMRVYDFVRVATEWCWGAWKFQPKINWQTLHSVIRQHTGRLRWKMRGMLLCACSVNFGLFLPASLYVQSDNLRLWFWCVLFVVVVCHVVCVFFRGAHARSVVDTHSLTESVSRASKWRNTIFHKFRCLLHFNQINSDKTKCEEEIKKRERERSEMKNHDGDNIDVKNNDSHSRSTFSLLDGSRNVCGTSNLGVPNGKVPHIYH